MRFIIPHNFRTLSTISTEGMFALTSQGHATLCRAIFTANARVGIAIDDRLGTRTGFLLRGGIGICGGDALATIATLFRTWNLAVFTDVSRVATIAAWFLAKISSSSSGCSCQIIIIIGGGSSGWLDANSDVASATGISVSEIAGKIRKGGDER